MDEARRFLRYVFPGLVFGVEVIILVWLVFPDSVVTIMVQASGESSLAVALGGLLASGGLGYIFATAHHFAHWHLPCDRNIINHAPNIRNLIAAGLLGEEVVDRRRALELTLELWYGRLGTKDGPIAAAQRKIAAIGDLAHAAGAARVASFAALATALCVCWLHGAFNIELEAVARFLTMVVSGTFLVLLFHDSYRRTGNIAQTLYDRMITAALESERRNGVCSSPSGRAA